MLWAQIEPDVYITRDQFVRGLADWDIEPVLIQGGLAFAGLSRGTEFHLVKLDAKRWITLQMLWGLLNPIMERHGFVTTRTPKEDARQHRFNLSFGFYVTGEDEFCVHYRLDPKKCQ